MEMDHKSKQEFLISLTNMDSFNNFKERVKESGSIIS